MFYVDLEPQHNNKDIYNLQYLRNMKIIIEPPNKNRTILQCTRCQLDGHNKSYCTRPYKCVKCGGTHMTTDCQKSKDTGQMCPVLRKPYRQLQGLYSLQRSNKYSSHTECQAPRSEKTSRNIPRTHRNPSRLCRLTTHTPRHSRVPTLLTNETTSDYNCIPSSTNSKQCSLN